MKEKVLGYIKTRGIGYWFNLVAIVLAIVALIIYTTNFSHSIYYEKMTIVFVAIGFATALLLTAGGIFIRLLGNLAPAALSAGMFISVLYFLKGTWFNIQDAVGGYESLGMAEGFWPFLIIGLISLIAGIAAMFMSQSVTNK